ncbi:DUF2332 domain-containing protein [Paracoccus zhejiangensis]|uniref:DUF2332 domain-containing protein n=1 Tax=Paracoccus zhejiangensis TaxID=1077935 RepID=A0A2H5EVH6_9RHOB|nr:DUF2332 family protein [Paracoccus zhejiangensis]AUH63308.1 DUF2332 domain-containing protein [Paracoccus zhejiangensis]
MTVRSAFADQAASCRALGSELTARVVERLGTALQVSQGPVAARVLGWPGDASSRGDSVPLRLAGALHHLVLSGRAPAQAAGYAAGDPSAEVMLAAIAANEEMVMAWLDSPPQTNEVGRSAALIAAARFLAGRHPLPFELLELGASAGLNLNFARYRLVPDRGAAPDPGIFLPGEVVLSPLWTGEFPEAEFMVSAAEGVDLRPVDPVKGAERLLAYCWADQAERLARLRAALAVAKAHPVPVHEDDAAGWLQARLADPAPGRLRLVYHTVAWQYFPPDTQAACEACLQAAGARASATAPLAHLSMEADGGRGAALQLRLWSGAYQSWSLGRADFHGRWVDWQPAPY